jgi:hypothetical protein
MITFSINNRGLRYINPLEDSNSPIEAVLTSTGLPGHILSACDPL